MGPQARSSRDTGMGPQARLQVVDTGMGPQARLQVGYGMDPLTLVGGCPVEWWKLRLEWWKLRLEWWKSV